MDAQNHDVFAELKRVQQYFAKIKAVEEPVEPEARTLTVNQEATARILKADLVGSRSLKGGIERLTLGQGDNKSISSKLAEKIAEERAKALLKSVENRKRPATESPVPSSASASEGPKGKKKQKQKHKSRSKGKK